MPNDFFRFKEFTVHQDKCAMKVCTDACLFGAWAAEIMQNSKLRIKKCLDIGTGTGLLSLIIAQKNSDAIINAVEIDKAAYQQAKENFGASPWKERLNVYNDSIQQFTNSVVSQLRYDIIISNPPFYESDLKSDDMKRNLALHSAELKLEELINIVNTLLMDDGNFFVLLPYHRTNEFVEQMKQRLFIKEKFFIKQTAKHNYFRSILSLTKRPTSINESELMVMNNRNEYSNEFKALLKDYYLHL